jgi:hypothetical protein
MLVGVSVEVMLARRIVSARGRMRHLFLKVDAIAACQMRALTRQGLSETNTRAIVVLNDAFGRLSRLLLLVSSVTCELIFTIKK